MTDIATLGLAIDSRPAVKAKTDLDALVPAAAGAERGFTSLSRAATANAAVMPGAAQAAATVAAAQAKIAANVAPATAALQRQAAAVRQSTSGFMASGANAAGVVKLNSFQVQNLSYQINDLAQVLATGQSPFRAIIQQGSQITQLFGPNVGVLGALKAIGPAFLSFFLNPLTLATVGLAVAAQAAVSLFGYITNGGASAEDTLKRQRDLIREISAAYGDSVDAARLLGRAESDMLAARALVEQLRLTNDLVRARRELASGFEMVGVKLFGTGLAIRNPFADLHVPQGFLDDARTFRAEMAAGTGNVIEYRKRLDELAKAFPTSENLAFIESERNATQPAYDAALAQEKLAASMRLAAGEATNSDRALLGLSATMEKVVMWSDALRSSFATGFGIGDLMQGLAGSESDMALWDFDKRFDPKGTALKTSRALTDSAKDRVRAIKDAIGASEIEINTLGKSVGQIELARANWQSYTALRAEAEHNHTGFDNAQYSRLVRENEALAALKQTEAEVRAMRDASFAGSQLGRTDIEAQVASKLRDLYGDDYQSHLNGALAGQIRINDLLGQTKDLAGNAFKGMLSDLRAGKSASDIFGNALAKIQDKLFEIGTNKLLAGIFGGFSGGFGGAGMAGGMGSALTGYIKGGINHSGYGPGDAFQTRNVHPAHFDDAPRFHTGIGPGERPAIIRNDESVLTPGQMRQLAPRDSGSAAPEIHIHNAPAGTTATATQSQGAGGRPRIDVMLKRHMDDTGAGLIDSGDSAMNKSLEGRYGLVPRL